MECDDQNRNDKKLSIADRIAKVMIETFTTHKFDELSKVEVTVLQGLVFVVLSQFVILTKI